MKSTFEPSMYAIDFGTSNSLLAAANPEQVHPPIALDVTNETDPSILRSIIYFDDDQIAHVGTAGLRQYVECGMQGRLLRSLKRFLPSRSFTHTQVGPRRYRLEELIATLLRAMREQANAFFATDVRRALLGRPARFGTDAATDRYAEDRLRVAAELAGFEQVQFCPEPVAAARDFQDQLATPKLVLIGDFGGGTSDFSVVRMTTRAFGPRDVLATSGVNVAGDAFDGSLMKHKLAAHFGANVRYRVPLGSNMLTMPSALMDMLCTPAKLALLQRRDVTQFLNDLRGWALGSEDKLAVDRLLCVAQDALGFDVFEAVEQTKQDLSRNPLAVFSYLYPGIEIEEAVTRDDFETATQDVVGAIIRCLDETLAQAGVGAESIDIVCLTGGTAQVPRLRQALRERFGHAHFHHLRGFHAVVEGLAQQAQSLCTST